MEEHERVLSILRQQCPHGRCYGHQSRWSTPSVTEYRRSPFLGIFHKSIFARCCGQRLWHTCSVQVETCEVCGARRAFRHTFGGLCPCCQKFWKF